MKRRIKNLDAGVPLIIVLVSMLILFVGLLISEIPSTSQPENSNSNPPVADDFPKEKASQELKKLREETSKLREETTSLRITNESISAATKWWTTWLTAMGGIIIALLVPIVAAWLNRTQKTKLLQDKEHARESHNLELFRDLGNDEPRIRIGAVAVLVQKLDKMIEDEKNGDYEDGDIRDLPMIVSVLISATKHEDKEEIQKYIADGLATALGAIVEAGKKPEGESPLKPYDFQGARLQNAWWKRIDARGVDFYKANLSRAGLREAFLSKAVLKHSTLTEAVLIKAHLDEASLQRAQLQKAKFNDAILNGADLSEADLREANLDGADLSGANLEEADLRGATLTGSIFNKKTKLARAKINKAEEAYLKGKTDISEVIWDDAATASSNLPLVIFPL
jgi:uncharacterized protein YjbI with pentapeptide repeats